MKVTIFALVAALCLAGVNANAAIGNEVSLPVGLEYIPETFAVNTVDIENFCIFSSFYWVARAALRTLKGVNCTIKEVIAIRAAAQAYIDKIHSCGTEAVAAFAKVITSAQSVIATCNKIINLNEQVCNNGESANGKKSTSFKCFYKLLGQLNTLYKQTKNTMKAIKKVPSIPSDIAVCTTSATNELTTSFTSFPSNIKTCSKLTSK